MLKKNKNYELFLYGKLRHKSKAVLYCTLHKCYLDIFQLREKKFKCNKCKHKKEI